MSYKDYRCRFLNILEIIPQPCELHVVQMGMIAACGLDNSFFIIRIIVVYVIQHHYVESSEVERIIVRTDNLPECA